MGKGGFHCICIQLSYFVSKDLTQNGKYGDTAWHRGSICASKTAALSSNLNTLQNLFEEQRCCLERVLMTSNHPTPKSEKGAFWTPITVSTQR